MILTNYAHTVPQSILLNGYKAKRNYWDQQPNNLTKTSP